MPPPGRHERRVVRKAVGLRARSRRRKDEVHEVTIDFTDPAVARRWKRRSLAVISVGAAVGITWYALAPGVASYQIGYPLALPALITAIVWVGKRLPRWLDWVIAVVVGAAGSLAYVLFDGSQWWLWAQVALLPFVLLVLISGVKPPKPGQSPQEPWYGGMRDGPWGPP
jgi:peptidoglycan/LPS O-acetylase OafA/YrhL